MTYEDITSIDTRRRDWSEELFHQRDNAIAEAEVLRLELKDLAEQRDALTRRVAELGVDNANLASQCARLRMQLVEVRAARAYDLGVEA